MRMKCKPMSIVNEEASDLVGRNAVGEKIHDQNSRRDKLHTAFQVELAPGTGSYIENYLFRSKAFNCQS